VTGHQVNIGAMLRKLRDQRSMTMDQVSHATNGAINSGYLSLLENGKIQQPKLPTLNVLAGAYGLTMRELLELIGVLEQADDKPSEADLVAIGFFRSLSPELQAVATNLLRDLSTTTQRARDPMRS
jgi:transcriptional regulator with XRE-family HTH domain